MKNEIEKHKKIQKKSSKRKYTITAFFLLLLLIASALVFIFFAQEQKQKPDPASEKIIRQEAAKQLGKDPKKVTDADFAGVRKLDLSGKEVYDIGLLEKFTNLEELNLSNIPLPKPQIPKWMVIPGKFHINLSRMYIDKYGEKYFIDLCPLEKLPNLKKLYIRHTAFKDIKPLTKIKNLQEIAVTSEFHEYKEYENFQKQLPRMELQIDSSMSGSKQLIEARIKSEFEKY